MRVAFVSWQPLAGLDTGYKRRVHCLASHLEGTGGMKVVVLSPPPKVPAPFEHVVVPTGPVSTVPLFSRSPVLGYRAFPGTVRLKRALERVAPDVVHSEGIWPFPAVRAYARSSAVPLAVTVHNIEHVVAGRTGRSRLGALFLRRLEKTAYGQADLLVCMSDVDRAYLEREMSLVREKMLVVPNGASAPEGAVDTAPLRSALGVSGPVILFMGKLDYRPNAEALEFLLGKVLPRVREVMSTVTFLVVGSPRPARVPPGALTTGRVSSVWPYLAAADVCVAPLMSGSGTRLKILEYMAAGKAVVATPVAVEGLDVTSGREAVLADHARQFAESIVSLLQDPSRAAALGRNGRQLVEARYRWEHIARRYGEQLAERFGRGRCTGV